MPKYERRHALASKRPPWSTLISPGGTMFLAPTNQKHDFQTGRSSSLEKMGMEMTQYMKQESSEDTLKINNKY